MSKIWIGGSQILPKKLKAPLTVPVLVPDQNIKRGLDPVLILQVRVFQLEPCKESNHCHVWKEVEPFADEEEVEVTFLPFCSIENTFCIVGFEVEPLLLLVCKG